MREKEREEGKREEQKRGDVYYFVLKESIFFITFYNNILLPQRPVCKLNE